MTKLDKNKNRCDVVMVIHSVNHLRERKKKMKRLSFHFFTFVYFSWLLVAGKMWPSTF